MEREGGWRGGRGCEGGRQRGGKCRELVDVAWATTKPFEASLKNYISLQAATSDRDSSRDRDRERERESGAERRAGS